MKNAPRWVLAMVLVLVFAFAFASTAYVEVANAGSPHCDCILSCAGGTGWQGGQMIYGLCRKCPEVIPCCTCRIW